MPGDDLEVEFEVHKRGGRAAFEYIRRKEERGLSVCYCVGSILIGVSAAEDRFVACTDERL